MKHIIRSIETKYRIALLLAILAGLLTATGAWAAGPGALDLSFGTNGAAITDLGSSSDTGNGVVVQNNGKILLAASAQLDETNSFHRTPIVLRYSANGTLDTTYGTNGRITTETGNFSGSRLALQSDGKLVVGGSFRNDIGVARYNTNGSIDTLFGTNGVATVHLSDDSRETCSDVAIQPDGKIVLAGSEEIGNYIFYFIARFNSNGTPDENFNDRGFQIVDFDNSRYNYGNAVAIQEDGKILMSGTMTTSLDPGDGPWITLARFNTDGSLDSTFGSGGKVTSTAAIQSNAGALAMQADGKILVGGTAYGTTDDLALARFNINGSLDPTFGGTGVVIGDFGNNEDGHDIVLQQDGRIVIAGRKYNTGISGFVLARYNANGSLDTTFGTEGQVVTDFGGSAQSANGATLQADGKIVVGGSSNGEAVVARYNATATDTTPITTIFRSVGTYDGWVLESTETSRVGGSFDRLATTFNVGDNPKDRQYRGLLSFNTASLPDTAVITSAQLKVKRQGIIGSDPFATHGPLLLLIRKGSFSGNVALQASDFAAAGSPGATKDLFSPLTFTWYRADLTTTNLRFIQKYGITQFRIQFTLDDNDNLNADYVKLFSGNSSAANQPQLLVTYYVP